ncbi:hypothetical protein G7084_04045 [Weissella coleopterorum]|uniref:Uncharacterized protein n=1 Tax=Weissella coleopterorum TaxID=2714949 RepID=A0A6G8B016_9LACO|nr:hypothetical protein [Weissella coleopterorum]QIL50555.1 hypothetical protein G7084_04045 [Weissella coleopterorum]
MHYLYDKVTKEYTGMTSLQPNDEYYTQSKPFDPDMNMPQFISIYRPETDDWRDWDKAEYLKWLDGQKPTQDQMTQAQMMLQIAQLTKAVNELKGDKNVSNN